MSETLPLPSIASVDNIIVNNIMVETGQNLDISNGNVNISDDLTVDTTTFKVDSKDNEVGIGTIDPLAKLHILSSTEQLRLGYDASNYLSTTIDSSGNTSIESTGGVISTTNDIKANSLYWYNGSTHVKFSPSLSTSEITIGEIGSGADYEFNSSTDISATLNPLISSGNIIIRFFNGTFRLSSPLLLQGSQTYIYGSSLGLSILNTDQGITAIRILNTTPLQRYRSHVKNIQIQHNGNNATGNTNAYGIEMNWAYQVEVDSVYILGFDIGIHITNAGYYNHFSNVRVLINGSAAVYMDAGASGQPNANRFSLCRFRNTNTSNNGHLIHIVEGNDNTFVNCNIEEWGGYAIYLGAEASGNQFNTCRLENTPFVGDGAVYFHDNSTYNIIQDCWNVGQSTIAWNNSTTNIYKNQTYSSQIIRMDQDFNNSNWINYRRNGSATNSEVLMHLEDLYSASGTPTTLKLSSARATSKLITGNLSGSEKFYASTDGAGYFSDNLSVGTTSTSGAIHVIKTTEQLRLGYDASNYLSTTVDSAGNTTFNTSGDYIVMSNPINYIGDKVYNAKAYGIKGDGVTNDQTAIDAFFNSVDSAGAVGFFPPGTYICSSTIAIFNDQWQCIRGADKNLTIFSITAVSNSWNIGGSVTKNLTISDITLDINSTSNGFVIYGTGSNYTFQNIDIINIGSGSGISISQSVSDVSINNLRCVGASINNGRGILIANGASNIRITNSYISTFLTGMILGQTAISNNITITNTQIINCGTGISNDYFVDGLILDNIHIIDFTIRGITVNYGSAVYTNIYLYTEAITNSTYRYIHFNSTNADDNLVECVIRHPSSGTVSNNLIDFVSGSTGNIVKVKQLLDISDVNTVVATFQSGSSGNNVIIEKLSNVASLINYYSDSTSGANSFVLIDTNTKQDYNQSLTIQKTTEQLRLAYDTSNYSASTVNSSGNMTIAPSGGTLTIANNAIVNTELTVNGVTFSNVNSRLTSVESETALSYLFDQNLRTTDDVKFNDINITGDLNVAGSTTTFNTGTVQIEDSIIELGTGNGGDVIDCGFYGIYSSSSYRGLIFDTSENKWILYTAGDTIPGTELTGTYTLSNFECGTVNGYSLSTLNSSINTNTSNIATNTSNISTNTSNIAGHETRITTLEGKTHIPVVSDTEFNIATSLDGSTFYYCQIVDNTRLRIGCYDSVLGFLPIEVNFQTISTTQWGYLSNLDQDVSSGNNVSFQIIQGTLGSFTRTSHQLELVYNGSNYTQIFTNENGDLSISPSGGDVSVNGGIYASEGYRCWDDRQLAPNHIEPSSLKLYFTSWNNDTFGPYADAFLFNSYTDGSGGKTNLVCFRKDDFGIRQYQETFGSASNFSSYMDCVMADSSGDVTISGELSVGTTNTNLKLTLGGSLDGGDTKVGLQLLDTSQSKSWDIKMNQTSDGDLLIASNSISNVMTMDRSNGYIGIGKTPSYPLDVNGNVNVDGKQIINSNDGLITLNSSNAQPNYIVYQRAASNKAFAGFTGVGNSFDISNQYNDKIVLYTNGWSAGFEVNGSQDCKAYSNLTVSGNITASNISTNTFSIADSSGSTVWRKMGNLVIAQNGQNATFHIVLGAGYNAEETQLAEIEIYFRTSNDSSTHATHGGKYVATGRVKGRYNFASSYNVKVNEVSSTNYDFYINLPAYTGTGSYYTITTKQGTWTHADTSATDTGSSVTWENYISTNTNVQGNLNITGNLQLNSITYFEEKVLTSTKFSGVAGHTWSSQTVYYMRVPWGYQVYFRGVFTAGSTDHVDEYYTIPTFLNQHAQDVMQRSLPSDATDHRADCGSIWNTTDNTTPGGKVHFYFVGGGTHGYMRVYSTSTAFDDGDSHIVYCGPLSWHYNGAIL